MVKTLVIFLLTCVFFNTSMAMKECVKATKTTVDPDFWRNTFALVTMSKCNNCEKKDDSFLSVKGRSAMVHHLCFKIKGKGKAGNIFEVEINCRVVDPAELMCDFHPKHTSLFSAINGTWIVTRTDNKHYMAGSTCLHGAENFWWIYSLDGEMEESLKNEIIADFEKQGFEKNNEAENGDTRYKKRSSVPCHKKEASP